MKNIEATGYTGNTSLEPMKWDYEELSAEEYLTLAFKKARTLDLLRL